MASIQIITTTSSIENWEINSYLGIVTDQMVIGANLFSDVFASFTDVFGGSSKRYQRDLMMMENAVMDNMRKKAAKLGANAIIGLRIDFDEVSGGGKSMFMLSASGTAVKATPQKSSSIEQHKNEINYIVLSKAIERDNLLNELSSHEYKINSIKDIEELTNLQVPAFNKVFEFIQLNPNSSIDGTTPLIEYFNSIDRSELNKSLLGESFLYLKNVGFQIVYKVLDAIDWFDFETLNQMINVSNPKGFSKAVRLLELDKISYSEEDIKNLNSIIESLKNARLKFPISITSKGLLGKEKSEWECIECGKIISSKNSSCDSCYSDIYGLPRKTNLNQRIDELIIKSKKLEELFKK